MGRWLEEDVEFQVQILKGTWIPIIAWTENPTEVGALVSMLLYNFLSTQELPKKFSQEIADKLFGEFTTFTRIVSRKDGEEEIVMTPQLKMATKEEMEELAVEEIDRRYNAKPQKKVLH